MRGDEDGALQAFWAYGKAIWKSACDITECILHLNALKSAHSNSAKVS